MGSFLANLPELLGAMAGDPRTILAVVEFKDRRYWQCWADRDESIVIEVVSNRHISVDATRLSDADEDLLRGVGFAEPSDGPNPNWRFEAAGIADLRVLVSMTCLAVKEVLKESPQNSVDVRTWEFKRPTGSLVTWVRKPLAPPEQRKVQREASRKVRCNKDVWPGAPL